VVGYTKRLGSALVVARSALKKPFRVYEDVALNYQVRTSWELNNDSVYTQLPFHRYPISKLRSTFSAAKMSWTDWNIPSSVRICRRNKNRLIAKFLTGIRGGDSPVSWHIVGYSLEPDLAWDCVQAYVLSHDIRKPLQFEKLCNVINAHFRRPAQNILEILETFIG